MRYFTVLPYKIRLISIYVSTTVVGLTLTLIAIYNASSEQLFLDHINNVHAIFSSQVSHLDTPAYTAEFLASKLSTEQYRVSPLPPFNEPLAITDACNNPITRAQLEQQRMSDNGGIAGKHPCIISWVIVSTGSSQKSLLILHDFDINQQSSLYSAYIHRLLIPLAFFLWVTIWGSLMLGNLINRLQIQKDKNEHMALHDVLTGLPNRQYFLDEITELINYSNRKCTPFVLAMIDLNKFKNVNDELGHQSGDLLLIKVAERIKNDIRDYDLVARLGGDEFVLLLPGTDIDSSMKVLDRVYLSIVKSYSLQDIQVNIGASIGVSYFPQHDTTYSELVHKADIAMYQAKEFGGGIKLFESSMTSGTNLPK